MSILRAGLLEPSLTSCSSRNLDKVSPYGTAFDHFAAVVYEIVDDTLLDTLDDDGEVRSDNPRRHSRYLG